MDQLVKSSLTVSISHSFPFFAPSSLSFVAFLKLSQLLNRLHRKFHLFILFLPPFKVSGCLGRFFFLPRKPLAFFSATMMTQKLPFFPRGVSDGFCSLCPCACACVNCKCSNWDISMVTQVLMLSLCIFLRTYCPERHCRPTDM